MGFSKIWGVFPAITLSLLALLLPSAEASSCRNLYVERARAEVAKAQLSSYWNEPRIINISSGVPRGGFGDVTANLLMARRFRLLLPDHVQIRIVVERYSEDAIKLLVPEYHGWRAVKVGGIEFVPESIASDVKADFAFAFSSADGPGGSGAAYANGRGNPLTSVPRDMERAPFKNVRYGFSFGEPVPSDAKRNTKGIIPLSGSAELIMRGKTGVGNHGLYLVPFDIAPAYTHRSEMVRMLNRALKFEEVEHRVTPETKIGFGYSLFRPATQYYVDVMREYLSRPEFRDQDILLLVKDFSNGGVGVTHPGDRINKDGFPPNVRIVHLRSRPFELDEAIIANADLPIMVTGDTSSALAIQYGKAMMLEVPNHKRYATEHLQAKLLELNAEFDLPGYSTFLHNLTWNPTARGLKTLNRNPAIAAEILANRDFMRTYRLALLDLREEASLVERSIQLMEMFGAYDVRRTQPGFWAPFVQEGFTRAPHAFELESQGPHLESWSFR